jgi:superfamily II DNA or RNA helicase
MRPPTARRSLPRVAPMPENVKNTSLLAHQRLCTSFMRRKTRLLCVHSTGAGKTRIAKRIAIDYLNEYPKRYVYVISPTSVLRGLQSEFQKGYIIHPRIIYMSYAEAVIKNNWEFMKNCLIIFDEAHVLGNPKLKLYEKLEPQNSRFQEVHKILMLTATPYKTNPEDLRVLAEILRKRRLYSPITETFIKKAFKNLVSVWNRTGSTQGFPTKLQNVVVNVPISNNVAARMIPVHPSVSATRKFLYDENAGGQKKFNAFLRHLHNTSKAIVYVEEVNYILPKFEDFLRSHGIKYGVLTGKAGNATKKKRIADHFMNSDLQVLIISTAGEAGINFRGVKQIHFLNIPYTLKTEMQVIGRANRRGNTNKVNFQVFYYKYTNPHNSRYPTPNQSSWNSIRIKHPGIKDQVINSLQSVSIENASSSPNNMTQLNTPAKVKTKRAKSTKNRKPSQRRNATARIGKSLRLKL